MRGTNLDGVRRTNLSLVLDLVHRTGGVSRSELTRRSGLNRSTVAALVAELVELGLAIEGDPAPSPHVGRPSPVVSPDPGRVAVAVNPELDAVTVGLVGLGGQVHTRVRREVDHIVTAAETVDIVRDVLDELAPTSPLGLGVAVPGLVRASDGLVRWAPHLGWRDEPIAELLAAATGLPAAAANDASLGAVAEHLFGAGLGVDDLVYLNGGASGIGGGVIANGAELGGASGYAGEFGQNRPGIRQADDRTRDDGTLEDEVSRARLLAALGLPSADELALSAALESTADAGVRAELARQVRVLSVAISNAVNVLNPRLVVLGGFLADVQRSDPGMLDELVRAQSLGAASEDLTIAPAALGPDLLMIGAGQLALRPVLADPGSVRMAPGA